MSACASACLPLYLPLTRLLLRFSRTVYRIFVI
jgi:hypothetical protein